jgi:hypothetical protein
MKESPRDLKQIKRFELLMMKKGNWQDKDTITFSKSLSSW